MEVRCHPHLKCKLDVAAPTHGFASRGLVVAMIVGISCGSGIALCSFNSLGSLPGSEKQEGEARALRGLDLPIGNNANLGDLSFGNLKHAAEHVKPAEIENDVDGELKHASEQVKPAEVDNDLNAASQEVEHDNVPLLPPDTSSRWHWSKMAGRHSRQAASDEVASKLDDVDSLEAERAKMAAQHPLRHFAATKLSDPATLEAERAKMDAMRSQLAEASRPKEQDLEPWHHRLHRHHQETRGHAFWSFIVHVLILFTTAYLVRAYLPQPLPQELPLERDPEVGRAVFSYGLFDEKEAWGDDKWLCFFAWCCMGMRWAETLTNDKVRLAGSFWAMLTISLLATHELSHLTIGMSHILFVGIAVYYRQQLREKFGLKSGTVDTLIQDCLVWCCCPCCAAAQEARQVERVSLTPVRESPTMPAQSHGGTEIPVVNGSLVQSSQRNPNAGQLQTGTSFSSYTEGSDSPRSNIGLLKAQE